LFLFRVRWVTALDVKVLEEVADFVRYDSKFRLSVYRFNPVKAAKFGSEKVYSFLHKLGVYVPKDVREIVNEISKENAGVYITFEGQDLAVYAVEEFARIASERRLIVWDRRLGVWKAKPSSLHEVFALASKLGFKVKTSFKTDYELSFKPRLQVKLRDYQEEAFKEWVRNNCRGVIVLPVGSGKTLVALKAIEYLAVKTVILVPTIDLLHQWKNVLIEKLGVSKDKVGVFGGGRREVKELTVMTYDSAYINLDKYPIYFGLVVADEVHHAVAPNYRKTFDLITAPYRLGLTATPHRSDGLHRHYGEIIGEIVYTLEPRELQEKGFLAKYVEEKIYVELSKEELKEYFDLMDKYFKYCEEKIPEIRDPKERFKKVLELAAKDPEAREALRARNKARQIALSAEKKIKVVEDLLKSNPEEKIIIFSRYTDIIREISRRFLIPRILHDTPRDERKEILRMFKEGKIRIIATAMALDEGVDVPDASMAIVISGTGSHREYVQRLGRILRPKKKVAKLVEIITKRTIEPHLAWRRRRIELFE